MHYLRIIWHLFENNLIILWQIVWATQKWKLNFRRLYGSWRNDLKLQNIVLIYNSRNTWPTNRVWQLSCPIAQGNQFFGSGNHDLQKIYLPRQVQIINKAVLEPRVSPAFAITYFCNHCNIRFENTSKYVDTLTLFSKNLNQRSLTPRWPLTPCLLRSLVWLYPRIIVSKSHGNTSMYVDTVINFANYHIHTHTTYYVHTTYILRTYYVQNEWSHSLLLNSVQPRQKLTLILSH